MNKFYEMTIYMIAMAITPGPNCILSMVNAAQKGFPKCLTLNFGIFAGLLVLDTAAYCLVSILVKHMPIIRPILQVMGILYIAYLAWCMFNKGEIKITQKAGDFKTGFVFQFMNMKAILLGVTVVSTYVLPANLTFFNGYLLMLYLAVICLFCGVTWAVGGAVLSKFYSNHRKASNIFFALTLLALAISNFITFINSLN